MDDDIDDQEIFEMALQEVDEKIHLITANDCAEGLKRLKENLSLIPDFIFLDINMPKMNGMQCLPEIKRLQHLSNSKVIMYSTSTDEDIQRTTRELGADEFLVKPAKIGLLIKQLTRILQKS
jgi:DNA-binding response OmpR family regulator